MTSALATDPQVGATRPARKPRPATPPANIAEIFDNASAKQYEAHAENGELMGWLKYREQGGNLITITTQTVPKFRSRGVASALTRFAFADAAAKNLPIDPACWYVAEYVQRNPELAKQVATAGW